MSIICPTVLAAEPHVYREQMERIASFAKRIQIDLADGTFAPATINPIQVWWPEGIAPDLHLMFKNPLEQLETIISLKPALVIVHAEAEKPMEFLQKLEGLGIKRGLAILPETSVSSIESMLSLLDHVLIFSGNLGHFGGVADYTLLDKAKELKQKYPTIEIGWDGGVNLENAKQLSDGGVDVLNVGDAIQRADDPQEMYQLLFGEVQQV